MHHFIGAAEIGERLHLSRQRVSQITASEGFPKPVVDLRMGKVWETDAVEEWIRENRPQDALPLEDD